MRHKVSMFCQTSLQHEHLLSSLTPRLNRKHQPIPSFETRLPMSMSRVCNSSHHTSAACQMSCLYYFCFDNLRRVFTLHTAMGLNRCLYSNVYFQFLEHILKIWFCVKGHKGLVSNQRIFKKMVNPDKIRMEKVTVSCLSSKLSSILCHTSRISLCLQLTHSAWTIKFIFNCAIWKSIRLHRCATMWDAYSRER